MRRAANTSTQEEVRFTLFVTDRLNSGGVTLFGVVDGRHRVREAPTGRVRCRNELNHSRHCSPSSLPAGSQGRPMKWKSQAEAVRSGTVRCGEEVTQRIGARPQNTQK